MIFVAEIGSNHNGSIHDAKLLITMAKSAGCDFVKFQKRTPDVTEPDHLKNRIIETPWGDIARLEMRKRLEFGLEEYDEIDRHCRKEGIGWFATAFDSASLAFLDRYNMPYHKVGSFMVTHLALLEEIAARKKDTIMSTGMCGWEELDEAVFVFRRHFCPLTLLHCVGIYPAPAEKSNLAMIEALWKRYGVPVGFSSHETGIAISTAAVGLGAVVIERHITLSRARWGADQAFSLEYPGLRQLVGACRKVEAGLGEGIKEFLPEEMEKAKCLRYWEGR